MRGLFPKLNGAIMGRLEVNVGIDVEDKRHDIPIKDVED